MPTYKPRILAQSLARAVTRAVALLSAGQWLTATVLFGSGVAAFGLVPNAEQEVVPSRQMVLRELPNPALSITRGDAAASTHYWREERIERGDTFGSVFARLGIDDPQALLFLRTDPSAQHLYDFGNGRPNEEPSGFPYPSRFRRALCVRGK